MKRRHLAMTAMALALAGNITVAYAAPGGGGDRSRGDRPANPEQKVDRVFNAVDADGSETITLDEWLVKPLEKAERHFNRIDSDDDNLISPEEFEAAGDRRRGHGRRGDRDGDVDRDAVRACVVDTIGDDVPERPDRDTLFAAIDTNDDGFIDLDEFLRARTEGATDRFNHIDADNDGAITKAELLDAMTQQRERRDAVKQCVEEQRELDELIG